MTAPDPRLCSLLDWARRVFVGDAAGDPPDVATRADAVRAVLADQLSGTEPPPPASDDSLPLGDDGELSIELCHLAPQDTPAPIMSDVRPTAWLTLRDGDRLSLQRFHSAGVAHPDVFDPEARLLPSGAPEHAAHASCLPQPSVVAHVLSVPAPTPLLRIRAAASGHFAWRFDPHTLQATALMPLDSTPGRLALMLDYFRASGDPAGCAIADGLLQHPVHFVRWKSVQLLAAHRPDRTRALLLQCAHADPHPAIRSTAGRLLEAGS